MFEDSMKNIRAVKALGMRTVLITGSAAAATDMQDALATKAGDAPRATDPAVDVALESCGQIKAQLPFLWEKRWPRC